MFCFCLFVRFGASPPFGSFVEELQKHSEVHDLHLWTATCNRKDIPSCLTEVTLREPLRSPPAVVREVKLAATFAEDPDSYPQYRDNSAPLPSDGPRVYKLNHNLPGHPTAWPDDCVPCGLNVATLLRTHLGVGRAGEGLTTDLKITG